MNPEIVYLGHDNTIDLILKADGTAQDTSAFTKITATFGDTLISSTDHAAGLILWNNSGYATGEIRIDIGTESVAAKIYHVPIIVYDATYTTGLVWGYVDIEVKAEVEAT